jgi:hypothetical protein
MTATLRSPHEPFRTTVIRNVLIAVVASTVFAVSTSRSAHAIRWPIAFVLMLWPTFGGHWLELWYLDWLRPRLPASVIAQRAARLATWFIGGCIVGIGLALTARALDGIPFARWPAWWLGGMALIVIELVAHAGLQLRGQPSFYNGRG